MATGKEVGVRAHREAGRHRRCRQLPEAFPTIERSPARHCSPGRPAVPMWPRSGRTARPPGPRRPDRSGQGRPSRQLPRWPRPWPQAARPPRRFRLGSGPTARSSPRLRRALGQCLARCACWSADERHPAGHVYVHGPLHDDAQTLPPGPYWVSWSQIHALGVSRLRQAPHLGLCSVGQAPRATAGDVLRRDSGDISVGPVAAGGGNCPPVIRRSRATAPPSWTRAVPLITT